MKNIIKNNIDFSQANQIRYQNRMASCDNLLGQHIPDENKEELFKFIQQCITCSIQFFHNWDTAKGDLYIHKAREGVDLLSIKYIGDPSTNEQVNILNNRIEEVFRNEREKSRKSTKALVLGAGIGIPILAILMMIGILFSLDIIKFPHSISSDNKGLDVVQNTQNTTNNHNEPEIDETSIISTQISDITEIEQDDYFALIIGIDDYKGIWPKLKNAVHDAKGIAEILEDKYKFNTIITLFNEQATRKNILDNLEKLSENISSNDNLLVYYSGHGEYKKNIEKGYWVPSDAESKSIADYISNSDIQTFISGISSRHTLLISDSCFSGDIFRGNTTTISGPRNDKYYRNVYGLISRQAITAGSIEPVLDSGKDGHSVFTYYLLKALDRNVDKFFDVGQLFEAFKIPVGNNSDQTPIFQAIKNTGDEGGQFIFVLK